MSESLEKSSRVGEPTRALGFWRVFIRERLYSLPRKIFCVLFALGTLSVLFYFFATNDGIYRSSSLKNRKAALELENLRLEEENRQLAARIERFGEDPVFLEDEARRKLRLVRPGEFIYRLAEEPELSDHEGTGPIK
ncbi:MAG: septum formation initiator family protein [Deltaproteobacteria bacterium]|jgi:cell division protein FtsB|nr:septum formation initiator family protein [Deltaproteobacteria bacterium]